MRSDASTVHTGYNYGRALALAVLSVLLVGVVASAASYAKTTLRELTQRALAVVEVEVVRLDYPAPIANAVPRTHTQLKVVRTLKGSLPELFTIDTPGGIDGATVAHVPGGAQFNAGERALVFVREYNGTFHVQDLGLGKFNVVQRGGETFVENPLAPKTGKSAPDAEADLFSKSIPYDTFCSLVGDYAAGRTPAVNIAELSNRLNSAKPSLAANPAVAAMHARQQSEQVWRTSLILAALAAVALGAAWWANRRRKLGFKTSLLWIGLGLAVAGSGVAGMNSSHAFNDLGIKWNLDRSSGKISNGKVVWRRSTASVSNPATDFSQVQEAFNQWEGVDGSRIAFSEGSSSTVTTTSNDAVNIVGWDTSVDRADFTAGTLALTYFYSNTADEIIDADIIFNEEDFTWNGTGGADKLVLSTALHEIGHFIGFGHVEDQNAVMYTFENGLVLLSPDEIDGARAKYPDFGVGGGGGGTPPVAGPPVAAISASPTVGAVGMEVSFSGEASAPGENGAPLSTYSWNFGDGSSAKGKTVTHRYTVFGVYTAILTVDDANLLSDTESVEIKVGYVGVAQKGSYRVGDKATFTIQMYSPQLVNFKAPKDGGIIAGASITIGSSTTNFEYDSAKGKSITKDVKLVVNDKAGTLVATVRGGSLGNALNALQAGSDGRVKVPVTIFFGSGLNVGLTDTPTFLSKGGKGKF